MFANKVKFNVIFTDCNIGANCIYTVVDLTLSGHPICQRKLAVKGIWTYEARLIAQPNNRRLKI